MHFILFYDFVENIIERRAPFRAGHLALAQAWVADGRLLLAGAFAEPVDGSALVFAAEDRAQVEQFVAADPYVQNGLVTAWRIRTWTVVLGAAL